MKLSSIQIEPKLVKRTGLKCANCQAKATRWWYADGDLPISTSCEKAACFPKIVKIEEYINEETLNH